MYDCQVAHCRILEGSIHIKYDVNGALRIVQCTACTLYMLRHVPAQAVDKFLGTHS